MIIFELTISFFPSFSQRNLGCKNWQLTRRRQTKYRTHLRLTGITVQKHFNGWLCLVPSCLSIGDSRANDERTEVRTEDFVLVLRYNCDLRSKPFQSSYCTKEILFFILVPTFSAISHRPLDTQAIYTLMRCYAIEESVNCRS